MKHLITICLLLGAVGLFGQTTMEEYNYLTKGYKIQQESGLDMKKGYSIRELGEWGSTNSTGLYRKGQLFQLYRDGEKTPCASLIIFTKTTTGWQRYQCVPHIYSGQEIWDKAANDFRAGDISPSNLGYSWAMVKMIAHLSTPDAYILGSASADAPPPVIFDSPQASVEDTGDGAFVNLADGRKTWVSNEEMNVTKVSDGLWRNYTVSGRTHDLNEEELTAFRISYATSKMNKD